MFWWTQIKWFSPTETVATVAAAAAQPITVATATTIHKKKCTKLSSWTVKTRKSENEREQKKQRREIERATKTTTKKSFIDFSCSLILYFELWFSSLFFCYFDQISQCGQRQWQHHRQPDTPNHQSQCLFWIRFVNFIKFEFRFVAVHCRACVFVCSRAPLPPHPKHSQ